MADWGPGLAALLGLVEGLTEFLPVSSTGHLILVAHLFGFTGSIATSVEISIQLGSILAIVVYERAKLRTLLSRALVEARGLCAMLRPGAPGRQRAIDWSDALRSSAAEHRHLWFLTGLGLAFVPAGVVGLLTHRWIEAHLFTPVTVALALILGGVLILAVEARPTRPGLVRLDQVGVGTAVLVGLAQCASLVPGVSRSGATIIGGLLAGMERRVATEYSFFLALPTMLAATSYKMLKSRDLFSSEDLASLAVGLLVAFFVAWAVIAAFLAFVKRHTLRAFAVYRILLGIVVLLLLG